MNPQLPKNQRTLHPQNKEFVPRTSNTNQTQKLFTQKTPEPKKSPFFKITTTIALAIVAILLYKTFASSGVGSANNISLNYDTNTIKQSEGKIECIEDDRILQWHEGLEMWECKKPTSSVFGELDKNNVKVNSSGSLECKEDNKTLIWDDNQWNCGDPENNITTENGLSIDSNDQLSIDSPTCSSNEKLIWNGTNFQCEDDQDEDEQTLSFTDNVLSILNGNEIDLSDFDNSGDLEDHVDDDSIHFAESDIDHNNIQNIGTNTHDQIDSHIANSMLHFTEGSIEHGSIAGLLDDDHAQYALLAGRSGGQTLIGGIDAIDNLTLQSTSNATKGKIFFGANSVYDEVNDRLGIGTATPPYTLTLPRDGIIANTDGNLTLNFNQWGINLKYGAVSVWNATPIGFLVNGNGADKDFQVKAGGGVDYAIFTDGATGFTGFNQNSATAQVHIKGTTSDDTTYALKVDDSSDGSLLSVRGDGLVSLSNLTQTQLTGSLTDDTPTSAEIDTATGTTAAAVGAGWQATVKDSDGSGKLYRIESDGTSWYYTVMTVAL